MTVDHVTLGILSWRHSMIRLIRIDADDFEVAAFDCWDVTSTFLLSSFPLCSVEVFPGFLCLIVQEVAERLLVGSFGRVVQLRLVDLFELLSLHFGIYSRCVLRLQAQLSV